MKSQLSTNHQNTHGYSMWNPLDPLYNPRVYSSIETELIGKKPSNTYESDLQSKQLESRLKMINEIYVMGDYL